MEGRDGYHHGALRQTLLDQALRSLEEGGLESLSLRSLAEAAGVSKTAPYRHFADKRALLVTMAAEGFRDFADRLEAALSVAPAPAAPGAPPATAAAAPGDATAAIRSLFRAYVAFALARPALYRLMFSRLGYSLHSESCRENARRALACLIRAVETAQTAGWRREQAGSALVLSLWAQVHGWAGLLIDGLLPEDFPATGEDPARFAEALLEA